jgi:hypothetical protein
MVESSVKDLHDLLSYVDQLFEEGKIAQAYSIWRKSDYISPKETSDIKNTERLRLCLKIKDSEIKELREDL